MGWVVTSAQGLSGFFSVVWVSFGLDVVWAGKESGRALHDTPPFAKCAKDGAPDLVGAILVCARLATDWGLLDGVGS
jgi:hypothetical protein